MKSKHLKILGYPMYERMTGNTLYPATPIFLSVCSYVHIFIFIDISEEDQWLSGRGRLPNPALRFISPGAQPPNPYRATDPQPRPMWAERLSATVH